jgi:hypothetical protein
MRLVLKGFLLLPVLMLAGSGTATCPYDGQTAYATGNTKTIYTTKGSATSCEYSHPVNMADARQGKHEFWALCE